MNVANVESFVGPATLPFVLLLIMYMPCVVLFSYILSFMFGKNVENVTSMLPPMLSVATVICFIIVSMVDLTASNDTATLIHYIFLVINPVYSMAGGLVNLFLLFWQNETNNSSSFTSIESNWRNRLARIRLASH